MIEMLLTACEADGCFVDSAGTHCSTCGEEMWCDCGDPSVEQDSFEAALCDGCLGVAFESLNGERRMDMERERV